MRRNLRPRRQNLLGSREWAFAERSRSTMIGRSFLRGDANKRGGSRQRKKTNFARAKVLLDARSEWYHRRRNLLQPGRLGRSGAAPVHGCYIDRQREWIGVRTAVGPRR